MLKPKQDQKSEEVSIDRYESFLRAVVIKTMKTFKLPGDMQEEFMSAAYVGLVEASQRFNPALGSTFEAYSYMRIRGSILDSIRKEVEHTGVNFRSIRAIRAMQNLEEGLQSQLIDLNDQEEALKQIMSFANSGSLCLRLCKNTESIIEDQVDQDDNPEMHLQRKNTLSALMKFTQMLPDKEKFVVEKYYFEGKSFVEIQQENPDLSKSWISRLHSRALGRLGMMIREDEKCSLQE